jgi:hypothetical protein
LNVSICIQRIGIIISFCVSLVFFNKNSRVFEKFSAELNLSLKIYSVQQTRLDLGMTAQSKRVRTFLQIWTWVQSFHTSSLIVRDHSAVQKKKKKGKRSKIERTKTKKQKQKRTLK